MDWNEQHKKHLLGYKSELYRAYEELIKQISLLMFRKKATRVLFSFSQNQQLERKIDRLFKVYEKKVISTITAGITKEWEFANKKNDYLNQSVLDRIKKDIPVEKYKELTSIRSPRNEEALNAFKNRKRGKFTISERVWNISGNTKTEMQFAVDMALGSGQSANELARNIQKYLNEPDKLFRRVRDKHGNLVVSKSMQNYKSGKGVYKSSIRNAERFAINEINIAYKEADLLRMRQNKDVVGYKVFLSPQHKVFDMCDHLKGDYPKSFIFNGWHVLCKCGIISILKTDKELIDEIKRGVEASPKFSENYVSDVPAEFKKWVQDNRKTIERRKSKPTFILDNFRYGKIVHGLKPMQ